MESLYFICLLFYCQVMSPGLCYVQWECATWQCLRSRIGCRFNVSRSWSRKNSSQLRRSRSQTTQLFGQPFWIRPPTNFVSIYYFIPVFYSVLLLQKIYLHVTTTNRAVNLYKRQGYQIKSTDESCIIECTIGERVGHFCFNSTSLLKYLSILLTRCIIAFLGCAQDGEDVMKRSRSRSRKHLKQHFRFNPKQFGFFVKHSKLLEALRRSVLNYKLSIARPVILILAFI